MALWNPWRGCHRISEGCKFCYIHKGDKRKNINTDEIIVTKDFYKPLEKFKNNEYKIKSNSLVNLCFSSDFLIEEADQWRGEIWKIIKERNDLNFLFLTKRIYRFLSCTPEDWDTGYENVIVGCTVENQKNADYKLSIFSKLPIKHKIIICQPLIEKITIKKYLNNIEEVVVGGESDWNGRFLDYEWVLSIRKECIEKNTHFTFRQCATNFKKDGKFYKLKTNLLTKQAKKANINT